MYRSCIYVLTRRVTYLVFLPYQLAGASQNAFGYVRMFKHACECVSMHVCVCEVVSKR